ncbi:RNA methyltransferase [Aquimarina sp. BL5]|uniref:TrmH family RNA methyltransferase n=1 Tax=Aquimarina sp. BL5 TaxID=1714860 RepID=UPI000E4B31AA|nr:RNA methyltransferase [Aquimarina sp. BL5]AXT50185.1 RNA methyltransferase [Aquimarina sp. BL5]RKN04727.1 RNA methyltransferase [Aquimarina sp. BL5]
MHKQITSNQNPKIKFLNQLKDKSRVRKKENRFFIEGRREISLAISGGYQLEHIYYCDSIISKEEVFSITKISSSEIDYFEITSEIYQKLSHRSTTEGILAIAKSKETLLSNLDLHTDNPLILVAESPEKPGNIGALLRTADAAKVDAVLIANPRTDIYNPNIIRSSVGCVFTNKVAAGSTLEIINFLTNKKINIYGAALQSSENYYTQDYTKPTAIVVGTEDKGLTDEWLKNTTQNIKIPMSGVIDSMNVSVAAGILIFEAKRQRNFVV